MLSYAKIRRLSVSRIGPWITKVSNNVTRTEEAPVENGVEGPEGYERRGEALPALGVAVDLRDGKQGLLRHRTRRLCKEQLGGTCSLGNGSKTMLF